jgi:hypothetical protein
MGKYDNVMYDNLGQYNINTRPIMHWAKEEYLSKLQKYCNYNPNAVMPYDIDVIEGVLNEIIYTAEFSFKGRKVISVQVVYETNASGFVMLETLALRVII